MADHDDLLSDNLIDEIPEMPTTPKKLFLGDVTPEVIEKAGYTNIFEAIVIASKWAREINLNRKRKRETAKLMQEFEYEDGLAPVQEETEEQEIVIGRMEKKVTIEAMQDLVNGKIEIEEPPL